MSWGLYGKVSSEKLNHWVIREDDGGERVVVGNRMASGVHLGPSQADTPQLTIQQNATMQLESEKFPINQNFVMS